MHQGTDSGSGRRIPESTALSGAVVGVLIAGLGLSPGCATSGALGGVQDTVAELLLPPEQEVALGRQMSAEIESQVTLHRNRELQDYMAGLGRQVVGQARDVPGAYPFRFKVIDDDETVNAMALPGGFIYVYSGLLKQVDTEAQLVAVLSHEVAHVTRRHVAERLSAAYGLQLLASIALGDDPGAAATIVAGVAQQGFLLKYGRDQETEADRVGIDSMIGANYDPQGAVEVFQKLAELGGSRPPAFLSSHPAPEARIATIREIIRSKGRVPQRAERERYQRMQRLV